MRSAARSLTIAALIGLVAAGCVAEPDPDKASTSSALSKRVPVRGDFTLVSHGGSYERTPIRRS